MANRDPEATKARILAAAVREFSAKGISGARVDAIAARAKVNKRMLYYYFESKEGPVPRDPPSSPRGGRRRGCRRAAVSDPDRLAERTARQVGETQYTRLTMWEALETDPDRPVNEELRRARLRGMGRSGRGGAARRTNPRRPRRRAARAERDLPRHGPVPDPPGHPAGHRDVDEGSRVRRPAPGVPALGALVSRAGA